MQESRDKSLLIYDGDCGFCRFWIDQLSHIVSNDLDFSPYQTAAHNFPQIPSKDFEQSIKLVMADGSIYSGAQAAFKSLAINPKFKIFDTLYNKLPGFAPISEFFYTIVASNRMLFSKMMPKESFTIAPNIFLRLVGIIYFLAFLSLLLQYKGLIGVDGINPTNLYLGKIIKAYGDKAFSLFPSLLWINSSDAFMLALIIVALIASVLLVVNFASTACLIALWVIYISFVFTSGIFLSYQWDALLLEVGFLSIFLSCFRDSNTLRFLFKFLLFKLMFSSGVVKLTSGDGTWRDLTALNYHYETQPIPNPISWYVHQLPSLFQQFSVFMMFAIELIAPWFIFAGRNIRYFACGSLIFLQILIIVTGNYCFFNLLSIALCVFLLNDDLLSKFARKPEAQSNNPSLHKFTRKVTIAALALILISSNFSNILTRFRNNQAIGFILKPISNIVKFSNRHRIASSYGLFAVMTTDRNEIILQGSNDGREWLDYELKWKPGKLDRLPGQVAPMQPRLDWQLWFASLRGLQRAPWVQTLSVRLLQGKKVVLDLFETNPFPDKPPKYIRAIFYKYNFTNANEKKESGNYWKREKIGTFMQPIKLRGSK